MQCPQCGSADSAVLETRAIEANVVTRRRRGCLCGCTFDTFEIPGGIWPTARRWAIENHAAALTKSQTRYHRDEAIVARVQRGEKRYLLAEELGLSVSMVSTITRRAGLAAHARYPTRTK